MQGSLPLCRFHSPGPGGPLRCDHREDRAPSPSLCGRQSVTPGGSQWQPQPGEFRSDLPPVSLFFRDKHPSFPAPTLPPSLPHPPTMSLFKLPAPLHRGARGPRRLSSEDTASATLALGAGHSHRLRSSSVCCKAGTVVDLTPRLWMKLGGHVTSTEKALGPVPGAQQVLRTCLLSLRPSLYDYLILTFSI